MKHLTKSVGHGENIRWPATNSSSEMRLVEQLENLFGCLLRLRLLTVTCARTHRLSAWAANTRWIPCNAAARRVQAGLQGMAHLLGRDNISGAKHSSFLSKWGLHDHMCLFVCPQVKLGRRFSWNLLRQAQWNRLVQLLILAAMLWLTLRMTLAQVCQSICANSDASPQL